MKRRQPGEEFEESWALGPGELVMLAGKRSPTRLGFAVVLMLSLHLLQLSSVYVNTLMIHAVLSAPSWSGRLTAEDLRGLTPLIFGHVNPYGHFELDMEKRLPLAYASRVP